MTVCDDEWIVEAVEKINCFCRVKSLSLKIRVCEILKRNPKQWINQAVSLSNSFGIQCP
jgi:hypothetical protein